MSTQTTWTTLPTLATAAQSRTGAFRATTAPPLTTALTLPSLLGTAPLTARAGTSLSAEPFLLLLSVRPQLTNQLFIVLESINSLCWNALLMALYCVRPQLTSMECTYSWLKVS